MGKVETLQDAEDVFYGQILQMHNKISDISIYQQFIIDISSTYTVLNLGSLHIFDNSFILSSQVRTLIYILGMESDTREESSNIHS